jgi:hypothetical protein
VWPKDDGDMVVKLWFVLVANCGGRFYMVAIGWHGDIVTNDVTRDEFTCWLSLRLW